MTIANQPQTTAPRALPKARVQSSQPRPFGALLLFAAVYVAVLAIMFAPKGSFIAAPQQVLVQGN